MRPIYLRMSKPALFILVIWMTSILAIFLQLIGGLGSKAALDPYRGSAYPPIELR